MILIKNWNCSLTSLGAGSNNVGSWLDFEEIGIVSSYYSKKTTIFVGWATYFGYGNWREGGPAGRRIVIFTGLHQKTVNDRLLAVASCFLGPIHYFACFWCGICIYLASFMRKQESGSFKGFIDSRWSLPRTPIRGGNDKKLRFSRVSWLTNSGKSQKCPTTVIPAKAGIQNIE